MGYWGFRLDNPGDETDTIYCGIPSSAMFFASDFDDGNPATPFTFDITLP